MGAMASLKGLVVLAGLGLPEAGPAQLLEWLKLRNDPVAYLSVNDPQKLLFDWTAEREYWRARRTEVEKDRPHRSELIDLCKQQEAAAESMIRQIESRLKNPPPVSMVRPTVSSVERIKERPRRSEPTPRRAVPDGR